MHPLELLFKQTIAKMAYQNISFDTLPEAIHRLNEKVESLERLLIEAKEVKKKDEEKPMVVSEAAKFLSLSVATIYTKTHKKEIPYYKAGKRIYFQKHQLIEYLKNNSIKTSDELLAEASTFLKIKNKG